MQNRARAKNSPPRRAERGNFKKSSPVKFHFNFPFWSAREVTLGNVGGTEPPPKTAIAIIGGV